jgi:hypothetical protein
MEAHGGALKGCLVLANLPAKWLLSVVMEHGVSGDTEGTLGIRIQFKIRKQYVPRHRTVYVLDMHPMSQKKKARLQV